MAPILTSPVGVGFQPLGPRLQRLLEDLTACDSPQRLVELLEEPVLFEEQVDLYQWIGVLNYTDATLSRLLDEHPHMLLIPRVKRKVAIASQPATSIDQVLSIEDDVWATVKAILRFWATLLRNSTTKSLFASVDEVMDLLAAGDDQVADLALDVLTALALPSLMHRQQTPEVQHSTTALHQSRSHSRLVSAARGYGSRADGLGLYQLITEPNLPPELGNVCFSYYHEPTETSTTIELADEDMLEEEGASSKKRRRVVEPRTRQCRPTAELFFLALEKAGGRDKVPEERWFALLTDVRMARDYRDRVSRIAAVERRLRALIAILHTHPSQEVMSGYFQAQPELTSEVVDLLRDTVSSANVSSAMVEEGSWRADGLAGLADSGTVPYTTRSLAVETLTALVARRDGSTAALSGSARLSSVLMELGVGKGQYLGMLPTLIRYSIASLGSAEASAAPSKSSPPSASFDIGLAFVEATMAPRPPRLVQVQQALEMVDNVLTLASAVVATPSGTAALTDCGLIPALLTTIEADTDAVVERILPEAATLPEQDVSYVKALLRFIAAQAVQIVEGATVTHSNALTAFHDLQGVEVLISRLSREISAMGVSLEDEGEAMEVDNSRADGSTDVTMEDAPDDLRICSSQRVLLFSTVTCLTVVFHQESTSSTAATVTTGGAQLRRKELTRAIVHILDNVNLFGGHLASLVATLLSDVMNSDPHIVHYVHESGLAKSFLNMVVGKASESDGDNEPILPPVSELIMAIPNVIAALSLTEDGAKVVKDLNPFPSLLKIFYHPAYAMPNSRCLLNKLPGFVGQGLDEIMRHVERLKPQVLQALSDASLKVVELANALKAREEALFGPNGPAETDREALENDRTCLVQYVLNIGQLLEEVLHNEDHCEPFVEVDGLDGLLKLFPASLTSGFQFLAYLSCLSSPSVSTLHHSTIEESMALAFKNIQLRAKPKVLLEKLMEAAELHLDSLDASHQVLFGDDRALPYALDEVSGLPLYQLSGLDADRAIDLSTYLRNVALVQWIAGQLATTVKGVCQGFQDSGTGWSSTEAEWKRMLSSRRFVCLSERFARFFQASLFEVCRVRTEEGFDEEERRRLTSRSPPVRYRLRIVCPEGAVVRDGIDIDTCANVGSMEMGEIADSFDRCINSSGILRYRTRRGWVSEMTRGHGREPIAEVISIAETSENSGQIGEASHSKRRIEAAVPGLRYIAVGVLARGQASFSELYTAISKLSLLGLRSISLRAVSFDEGSIGEHVAVTLRMLSTAIEAGFTLPDAQKKLRAGNDAYGIDSAGVAMYYGCLLSHVQSCLFDDKKERRMVNLPLLVSLASSDSSIGRFLRELEGKEMEASADTPVGLFGACSYIFQESVVDFARRSKTSRIPSSPGAPNQRIGRSVAASFPPLVAFLRRLVSTPISSSPVASIMSRVKWKDISSLLGRDGQPIAFATQGSSDDFFEPERFVTGMLVSVSFLAKKAWADPGFTYAPPHLVHPLVTLVGDIMVGLEDVTKKKQSSGARDGESAGFNLSDYFRRRRRQGDEGENEEEEEEGEDFEPDEAAVALMAEMGFDRERALDALESTRSNHVEVAMEYALNHAPPSPGTIERRRAEREERRRQRAEAANSATANEEHPAVEAEGAAESAPEQDVAVAPPPDSMDVDQPQDNALLRDKNGANSSNDLLHSKAELESWTNNVPKVCISLLSGLESVDTVPGRQKSDGDGEAEAVTVVVCSFLLDLCHRYPDRRDSTVKSVLSALRTKLVDGQSQVGAESSIAALSHAAVLFTRALPKTRGLVLKSGVVGLIVTATQATLMSGASELPSWLAPALLLLDIMAQPVVGFSKEEEAPEETKECLNDPTSEYDEVKAKHKDQAAAFSELAKRIFGAVIGSTPQDQHPNQSDEAVAADEVAKNKNLVPFDSIPAYFPLLPTRHTDACLDICLRLIERQPGPGVAQSALLLLLRLLRSPHTAAKCRSLGAAEAILALPGASRFTGNTGLVAIIFRRLLEDETMLQTAMETEIRSTVNKLQTKKPLTGSGGGNALALHDFIEVTTPLLCRDPTTFLKALAVTVKVGTESQDASKRTLSLLTVEEQTKQVDRLAEMLLHQKNDGGEGKVESRKHRALAATKGDGKSPHRRRSSSKRHKKEKHVGQMVAANDSSPGVHITSLLISAVVAEGELETKIDSQRFLSIGNKLEILTELALAVPACASAIHNYRPNRTKSKTPAVQFRHALPGCAAPPKTFMSYLLHSLLPQDRWTIRNDSQIWDRRKNVGLNDAESAAVKKKRAAAYEVTKACQGAARLVLALVARPGEGRKRVIADLVFALSGGRLGHGAASTNEIDVASDAATHFDPTELHALNAWGELCLGVAAPRSTGKNIEGVNALNVDNVRLMMEGGMVHALFFALHRVKLFHPMASNVCGALLVPIEFLTRPTVSDAVRQLAEKGKSDRKGSSPSHEMEVDAGGLADADTMAVAPPVGDAHYDLLVNAGHGDFGGEEDDSDAMEVDDEGLADRSDDEGASETDSSEESSDGDESLESEMDEDESDEDGEEGGSSGDDSEISSEEVEEEDGWNVLPDGGFVVEDGERELDDADEEDVTERIDQGIDEGWTRIEATGFGGMLLGSRGLAMGTAARGGSARGFIDAAEAMIGTLLRNGGELSNETLAELEGTLGIRAGGSRIGVSLGAPGPELPFGGRMGGEGTYSGRRDEVLGTLPHVHQRNQPDVGYSAFGSTGRWSEISSMEYVFGGPSVTAGSRNYDLTASDEDSEDEGQPHLTQMDLQLFPNGPVVAGNTRTQHSLHPLLCGVDLPPSNALVTDLLPHGIRATRFGQMTTRRPGDWTTATYSPGGYLVSTSNGNIIRSNRPSASAPLGSGPAERAIAGPVGWTDDGLPVDATVETFSSAFERVLAETAQQEAVDQSAPTRPDRAALSDDARGRASEQDQAAPDPTVDANVTGDGTDPTNDPALEEDSVTVPPSNSNEGDRVATSLAEGLRLSPGSSASDRMSSSIAAGEEAATSQAEDGDSPRLEGSSGPPAEDGEEPGQPDDGPAGMEEDTQRVDTIETQEDVADNGGETRATADDSSPASQEVAPNSNGLVCPPGCEPEVFNSLPIDMQQDIVNQYAATQDIAAEVAGSSLDPADLAALPEDIRREVIEQDRRDRQMREERQVEADPSRAAEMDPASLLATLSPELRQDILLTADEAFLNSLPPNVLAEANLLRQRMSVDPMARRNEEDSGQQGNQGTEGAAAVSSRKKQRTGKMRIELEREHVTFIPETLSDPVGKADMLALIGLLYLLTPVRPPRLLQKVFQNLFGKRTIRSTASTALVELLHENGVVALAAIESLESDYETTDKWRPAIDKLFAPAEFPPSGLIGAVPEIPDSEMFNFSVSASLLRRKQGLGTAAAIAANLPTRPGGSRDNTSIPPVVAARVVDTLLQLCKGSPRFCVHVLMEPTQQREQGPTCFELLLDLLEKPIFTRSTANLDQLLTLLEAAVSPLSHIPKHGEDELELSQRDIDAAATSGRQWVEVPRVTLSQSRLQMLCSILRMESCRDSAFTKVNTIVRRLCRVEMNRGYVLSELASVAHALGSDAKRDLRALKIRMESAATKFQLQAHSGEVPTAEEVTEKARTSHISSSVTLSTSSSELKLLRVLQTLQALCGENWEESGSKKSDSSVLVTEELVHLLRQLAFDDLWDELSECLSVVQVLEGVKAFEDEETKDGDDPEAGDDVSGEETNGRNKKLRNSSAGLLTRFLPAIEAFFVANGCATRPAAKSKEEDAVSKMEDIPLENLVGGQRLIDFVATNKVLLNALVRNNSGLLDKGLRALVQVPRCRGFLDFDVKRQWFKTQMRRLRQQASRRHGSLRLHIRRKHVFEDAYHQLRLQNADEMRGRLHITFRDEEGVDAGGLSREFFGILAKEMFNPDYALFTSTEDGCTFQPNPNSSINGDHLSYFRFVGRIVGKAVADGFLLDAHFTRSLYKHMLGLKPTHHDMEAIDPDYYRSLNQILEHNLDLLGLDLTFSIEDHSFGRSQTIDLIPNGRSVHVTEENKEEYIRLICQHRMTTAIQSQIKAYLDGFYELVSPELIAIFTPRELELLISGLPDIDVNDLKKNTDYVGWKSTDKEIEWFWNILFSLSRSEKASFLQFVTGSSKVPLAGFSELQGMRGVQKFSIHQTSAKKGSLMSAHTCFNSLDLPHYSSEPEMREKLLYAINEGGGAFLFA